MASISPSVAESRELRSSDSSTKKVFPSTSSLNCSSESSGSSTPIVRMASRSAPSGGGAFRTRSLRWSFPRSRQPGAARSVTISIPGRSLPAFVPAVPPCALASLWRIRKRAERSMRPRAMHDPGGGGPGGGVVGTHPSWSKTMCPYCGVGCGLLVRVQEGRVTKVKGDPDHPANFGDICAKAVHLPPVIRTDDRLLYPQIRGRRDASLERVSWERALRFTGNRLQEIVAAHGPDAVAFYGSGQLLTEEYYVASKLAKGFFRTNNFDTNSRLCMASAAVGYTRSLRSDRPPAAYEDFELADCFFLIGTNTADCHPIIFKRVKKRKLQAPDEVFVIVADPRWTETADIADLHLPLRPGSDIALLNAILHVCWKEKLVDQCFIEEHTSGWDVLRSVIERYPPERAEAITGLSREIIVTAAIRFGQDRK